MGELMRMMGENPLATMGAAFALLLVVCFFFRTLVKIALVLLIIAIAVGGYVYLTSPGQRPATLEETVEKTLSGTGRTLEKGKKIVDQGKTALEQGIDKGKRIIERTRSAADDIGRIIGGDKGSDSP